MEQFVVISGCSGGGKSTLLAELGRRGHSIVEEPGRRIIKQELQDGGAALPWIDAAAFARRAIAMARTTSRSPSGLWLRRSLMAVAAGLSLVVVMVGFLSE
jgi:predicted ATPase